MKHKDRLLMAINHEEPDRVPLDAWYTPELETKMLEFLGQDTGKKSLYASDGGLLPHLMEHDFLMTWLGPCTGFYMKDDPEYTDEWGIGWRWVSTGAGNRYTEIVRHPLAEIADPAEFSVPDFKREDRYANSRALIEKHGKEYGIIGALPCTLLELSWYLRGMDSVLTDMLINKDFYHAYLDKLMTWVIDAGTKLTQMGVDVIWIGDDFGTQDRLMISPELFREFFKPRYERLFTRLREINPKVKFAFHSDGYIYPIIKDFIEIGLDILNPVQPKSMDPARLKKEFGRHLTFWGTVDNQFIMPLGTVEDVINEVKLRLQTLGPGGGLIIAPAHNLQLQTSVEKVLAFYETVKKYGTYPIRVD